MFKARGNFDWTSEARQYRNSNSAKTYIRKRSKPGQHVVGPNEGKVLRKIMSETGLSEKEIREVPKYRKELAEAQKNKLSEKAKSKRIYEAHNKKWKGSAPTICPYIAGKVYRKVERSGLPHFTGGGRPVPDVTDFSESCGFDWIIIKVDRIVKPINKKMEAEIFEITLQNWSGSFTRSENSLKGYQEIPDDIVEKWRKKETYKKFGL